MKIGVYGRGLSGLGGVKQYIESMTRAIIRQLDPADELYVLHNLPEPYFDSPRANVHELLLRSSHRLICDLWTAPRLINDLGLDVVWFTKAVVPPGIATISFVTIHDMAYYLPDLGAYRLSDTLYMRTMIKGSCRRAAKIIAVSGNTRDDVLKVLGTAPQKVAVVHEASDERFGVIDDSTVLEDFRQRHGLGRPYILFTGGISPRKNLGRLIEAFSRISDKIDHQLVITGAKGWRNRDVMRALERNERVRRLGFVPDQELPLLYNGADLFVYPSLYEGFGLPVLEAQRCGCPVVCSQNSSLVEVGGDAVVPIDPLDVAGMAHTIERALSDQELRRRVIARGFENEKRFSWDRSARRLLELFGAFGRRTPRRRSRGTAEPR